jgi:hypothetical protein
VSEVPDDIQELLDAAAPRPPVNARLVLTDGREVPLELTYLGVIDGAHQWNAPAPQQPRLGDRWRITCDRLPARTTISLTFNEEPPGFTLRDLNPDGRPPT